MDKFKKTIYGYDPEEVNAYLDEIISLVEKMVASNKEKNVEIIRLSKEVEENRTRTKVEMLTEENTIKEIARIATGDINDISIEHAKKLRKAV